MLKSKVMEERTGSASTGHSASIPLRVLMLDDDPRDVELCIQELKKAGFELNADIVDTEEAFTSRLQSRVYDLILSDYRMPAWTGLDAFHLLKQSGRDIPFILVSGTLGEEAAVDLIKEGVTDYILKDRLIRLPSAIRRALEEKATRDERERAEQELRRSEARVRRLVESNIIGIAIGDLNGKLIDANGAFLELVGYAREDLLPGEIRWRTLTPPEYRDSDERAIEQLGSKGVAFPWEKQLFRKDGSRISVLIGVTTLVATGGDVECVSFVLDISERKKLEQQLRQAQKMEAIGQLAGGIAHDFNNLLGVIIGYGEIVEEGLNENDPLRAKVQQIKKAGLRAAGLTRQLLAFSRQQILEPRILSLNSIVLDVQKMLQRLIGENIELVTSLPPHLASVKADQGQIEQVIMNLAVNSRDAMPDGGTLTIETANVELDELCARNHPGLMAGSYVMLRVTDTGSGINAETQKHIFEPFFTTKELGKGTGLGLATVFGVVKQSSGYISVSSELGQGTTFKIYLPKVQAVVEIEQQRAGTNGPFQGTETVLLVEDEESLRKLTREILLENHYTVLEASDGLEAIEIAREQKSPIHLLLTDVVMPRMGGPALAKHLAIQNPEMKVLYMSGYTGSSDVVQELANTQSHFLQKPFECDTLTRKMREVLGSLKGAAKSTNGVPK